MISLVALLGLYLGVLIWYELVKLFPSVPCGPFALRAVLAGAVVGASLWINAEYLFSTAPASPVCAVFQTFLCWCVGICSFIAAGLLLLLDPSVRYMIVRDTEKEWDGTPAGRFGSSFMPKIVKIFPEALFRGRGLIRSEKSRRDPVFTKE